MVLLGFAGITFCLGLFAVVRVPHKMLWPASVLVSEWGHLIGGVPLLLLVGGLPLQRAQVALFLAACAVALLLSPLIRAFSLDRGLPVYVQTAFGEAAPRSLPDAPARPRPLVVADLLNFSVPRVTSETLSFKPGLTLDLYRRSGVQGCLPVVLVVHGGSWQYGDSRQLPDVNHYLARRGYAVAAVNYRKAPVDPFPAALVDVIAAIDYLKAQAEALNLDPLRYVLLGRSAGGQVALVAAYSTRDPAIRGVVSLYAPTDLVWSWENPGNPRVIEGRKLLRDYLGGTPCERPDAYRAASPLQLAHPLAPPTLLFHGGRDELVWLRQSERLAKRLAELRVNHLFVGLDWADHGFDANLWGPAGQIYLYVLERFLAAVTRGKRAIYQP